MYLKTIFFMLIGWFAGLILDANIGYGDYCGLTSFRILFPLVVMSVCILSEIEKMKKER